LVSDAITCSKSEVIFVLSLSVAIYCKKVGLFDIAFKLFFCNSIEYFKKEILSFITDFALC